MPGVYDVSAADIAAELPGLFPGGFSASTKPSDTAVESLIVTADTIIQLKVQDVTGVVPANTDKAAVLAREFVKNWVIAHVMRIVYAGNDPVAVRQAAEAYTANAIAIDATIVALGAQAAGSGEAASRVEVPYTTPQRGLLVTSEQLDSDEGYRERRY